MIMDTTLAPQEPEEATEEISWQWQQITRVELLQGARVGTPGGGGRRESQKKRSVRRTKEHRRKKKIMRALEEEKPPRQPPPPRMVVAAVALGQPESVGQESEARMTHIREETLKDSYYGPLLLAVEQPAGTPLTTLTARQRSDLDKFVSMGGCLHRIEQVYKGGRAQLGRARFLLYIPPSLVPEVLYSCHDHLMSGGHLGVQKTYEKVRVRYYWPRLWKTVEEWVPSLPNQEGPSCYARPRHPITHPGGALRYGQCGHPRTICRS